MINAIKASVKASSEGAGTAAAKGTPFYPSGYVTQREVRPAPLGVGATMTVTTRGEEPQRKAAKLKAPAVPQVAGWGSGG